MQPVAVFLSRDYDPAKSASGWVRGTVLGEPLLAHRAERCGAPALWHSHTEQASSRCGGNENDEDEQHRCTPEADGPRRVNDCVPYGGVPLFTRRQHSVCGGPYTLRRALQTRKPQ
jgi:hypothetical protein